MEKESKELLHEGLVVLAALAIWEVSGSIRRKVATYQNKKFIKKVLYSGDKNLEEDYNNYVVKNLEMKEDLMCFEKHLDDYTVEKIYHVYCAVKQFKKEVLDKK